MTALAGELGAALYILTIQRGKMTNLALKTLLRSVSGERAIVLIEDVDKVLPKELVADPALTKAEEPSGSSKDKKNKADGDESDDDDDKLTLAGLLEALNGNGASSGRILFMSTNHIDALPRSLLTPGIVDKDVQFTLATPAMCKELFIKFYLMRSDEGAEDDQAADSDDDDEAWRARLSDATEAGVPASTVFALAEAFAEACGDRKKGLALIQGHLLEYRDDPQAALDNIASLLTQRQLGGASRTASGATCEDGGNAAVAAAQSADSVVSSSPPPLPAQSARPPLSSAPSALGSASSVGSSQLAPARSGPLARRDASGESTAELLRRQRRQGLSQPDLAAEPSLAASDTVRTLLRAAFFLFAADVDNNRMRAQAEDVNALLKAIREGRELLNNQQLRLFEQLRLSPDSPSAEALLSPALSAQASAPAAPLLKRALTSRTLAKPLLSGGGLPVAASAR